MCEEQHFETIWFYNLTSRQVSFTSRFLKLFEHSFWLPNGPGAALAFDTLPFLLLLLRFLFRSPRCFVVRMGFIPVYTLFFWIFWIYVSVYDIIYVLQVNVLHIHMPLLSRYMGNLHAMTRAHLQAGLQMVLVALASEDSPANLPQWQHSHRAWWASSSDGIPDVLQTPILGRSHLPEDHQPWVGDKSFWCSGSWHITLQSQCNSRVAPNVDPMKIHRRELMQWLQKILKLVSF